MTILHHLCIPYELCTCKHTHTHTRTCLAEWEVVFALIVPQERGQFIGRRSPRCVALRRRALLQGGVLGSPADTNTQTDGRLAAWENPFIVPWDRALNVIFCPGSRGTCTSFSHFLHFLECCVISFDCQCGNILSVLLPLISSCVIAAAERVWVKAYDTETWPFLLLL